MIYTHVHDIVTDDVVLELPGFLSRARTFLKLEGLNPAGSVKLKTAVALVESAERAGRLGPGSRVIESSSGNLGIALAQVCAAKRIPLTVVTDPNANRQSVRIMESLGADVVVVQERDANGGYLGTRIALIVDRLAADPGLVWLNQYANPAGPAAHRDRTAAALHRQLPHLDALFVGVGTSGTAMGCVEYYRTHSPGTRLYAVDSEGSVTFGGPAGARHIPGLGTSRRPELFRDEGHFTKVVVPEADAVRMCRRLAREHGLLVGGSTGTVLAAVRRTAHLLPDSARIAAISPDLGERYLETVFCDAWVRTHFPALRLDAPGGHRADTAPAVAAP
ncbi:2,3-diaminopropionate biosynthesis protein SbnA [Streptomyces sp. NPDC048111]|uniref:2,3-diaminopropionate biosynthesis protein SbnA n=1 Tax=Streptomyces sp. NPDC048111 TaxID=3365500 RepID=UPI003723B825